MKRLFPLIFCLSFLFNFSLFGQEVTFKLRGGSIWQSVVTGNTSTKFDPLYRYGGGAQITFNQLEPVLMQLEALFVTNGRKLVDVQSGPNNSRTWLYNYIDLNFHFERDIFDVDWLTGSMYAGPGIGYMVSCKYIESRNGKITTQKHVITDDIQRWAVNANAGLKFINPDFEDFSLEVRYSHGLLPILDKNIFDVDIKNRSLQILLGYNF